MLLPSLNANRANGFAVNKRFRCSRQNPRAFLCEKREKQYSMCVTRTHARRIATTPAHCAHCPPTEMFLVQLGAPKRRSLQTPRHFHCDDCRRMQAKTAMNNGCLIESLRFNFDVAWQATGLGPAIERQPHSTIAPIAAIPNSAGGNACCPQACLGCAHNHTACIKPLPLDTG